MVAAIVALVAAVIVVVVVVVVVVAMFTHTRSAIGANCRVTKVCTEYMCSEINKSWTLCAATDTSLSLSLSLSLAQPTAAS